MGISQPGSNCAGDENHAMLGSHAVSGDTTAWHAVNGCWAGTAAGPTNVPGSAGVFVEDNLPLDPNCGGSGHPSTNNFQPTRGAYPLAGQCVVWSAHVRRDNGTKNTSLYLINKAGGSALEATVDLGSGAIISRGTDIPPGGWTFTSAVVQKINIPGNVWYRPIFRGVLDSDTALHRNNIGIAADAGGGWGTGDRTSGLRIYGLMASACATTSIASTYIDNPSASAPASTTADVVTFPVPAGIGHLIFTYDDGTKQTFVDTPGAPYTVNPATLNRPWIKLIDGTP